MLILPTACAFVDARIGCTRDSQHDHCVGRPVDEGPAMAARVTRMHLSREQDLSSHDHVRSQRHARIRSEQVFY
jgi:hypothetical protein